MINYLRAEFYRIINKKSLSIYLASLIVIYTLMLFIRRNNLQDYHLINEMQMIYNMLPFVIGAYLFSIIFHDDLQAKTLPIIIGFGRSKTFVVIAKLILMTVFLLVIYPLIFWGLLLLYRLFGVSLERDVTLSLFALLAKPLLLTIGYFTTTLIVTYRFQKTTFSIVTYTLFSVGLIGNLLRMVLGQNFVKNIVGDLTPYTLNAVVNKITEQLVGGNMFSFSSLLLYCFYIVTTILITIFVFEKSELDFA